MDIDWPSLEAMIVQAADAISAARPGARRDILESYVKRLEKLESIADSFEGVSKAFALQAGREIRIVVESESRLGRRDRVAVQDIARRIENELQYPGQINVTVSVKPGREYAGSRAAWPSTGLAQDSRPRSGQAPRQGSGPAPCLGSGQVSATSSPRSARACRRRPPGSRSESATTRQW